MIGPDFVREFPEVSYSWAVFLAGEFLMYLTATYLSVEVVMFTLRCFVDTASRTIDLM